METALHSLAEISALERQAMLERLAGTLVRNAQWAANEGDDGLEMVMISVGKAIMSVADDLAHCDVALAEDVASRALTLIATFHCRHPHYPTGPAVH